MVFKIVPIEGSELVNGAPQKKAHEMAAEALIALTLTHLRTGRVPGGCDVSTLLLQCQPRPFCTHVCFLYFLLPDELPTFQFPTDAVLQAAVTPAQHPI